MKDITERKRMEWELAESEARYRSLFEYHPDAVYSFDPNGRFTSVNDAGVAVTGYRREDLLEMIFDFFIVPEYLEKSREYFLKALAGEPQNYESCLIRKDGRMVFLNVTNVPIIVNKEVVGVYGIAKDISENKLAEEKLLQAEKKYRGIIENILEVYYRSDRDGRLIMASPSGFALLGYNFEDDWIGMSIADDFYYNSGEREKIASILRAEGSVKDFEVILRHRNGTPVPVSTSSRYYYNEKGEILGVEGIFRDIRERKQAEKALQESDEKYRQLFAMESDALFLIDNAAGQILEGNIAASSLYGYTHDELLKMQHTDLSAEPSETRRVTLEGKTFIPLRWHRKKDGTVFPVEISARHIVWQGRASHIAAIRDITDRLRIEEELRNRKQELEEKTNALQEMNAALRVLLRQRDDDKKDLEEKIQYNIKELVLPHVKKLINISKTSEQLSCIEILEENLHNVLSPFMKNITLQYSDLTPKEIQIANFIKDGKTTKDIAALLAVSAKAIEFHRNKIRNKLNLKNKKNNLRSYLLTHS